MGSSGEPRNLTVPVPLPPRSRWLYRWCRVYRQLVKCKLRHAARRKSPLSQCPAARGSKPQLASSKQTHRHPLTGVENQTPAPILASAFPHDNPSHAHVAAPFLLLKAPPGRASAAEILLQATRRVPGLSLTFRNQKWRALASAPTSLHLPFVGDLRPGNAPISTRPSWAAHAAGTSRAAGS